MDKTLLKGLMVLEAVTDVDNPPRTIDALAARVGLTRSNTHRTLQTLIHAGYVIKDDEGGGYRGAVRLFELAARQLAQLDVRKLAAPYMRTLADQTGETVHLSVLDGFDVVYVDKIDSPQPIRAYSMIGGRAPAYAVATGKALLAYQSDGYVERYADQLQRHTPATIVTMPLLKDELRKVVRAGYAINRGEWREGVGGLAVALFNSLTSPWRPWASRPLDRLSAARMKQLAPDVACAQAISQGMGIAAASWDSSACVRQRGGDAPRLIPRQAGVHVHGRGPVGAAGQAAQHGDRGLHDAASVQQAAGGVVQRQPAMRVRLPVAVAQQRRHQGSAAPAASTEKLVALIR